MFSSPARTRRTWPLALTIVVAIAVGLWFGGHPAWLPAPLRSIFVSQTGAERQVQAVLDVISRDYYRRVDTRRLLNVGLSQAVASLGDPYSHYYSPTAYRGFLNETNPHLSGIGVDIVPASGNRGLEIDEVFAGTPAARAGLRQGDVIIAVGPTSLIGRDPNGASALIKGRAGTSVILTVLRHGHHLRIPITRARIVVPVVSDQLLSYHGMKLGWLQFTSFTEGSAGELRADVAQMLRRGAHGLILDLRNNPGGLLTEAVRVASIFVADGTIVTTRGRSQPTIVYTATGHPLAPQVPLVVLVNRGTASSAEIVTGALKDRGRATVVGTHTYGKGVFQEIEEVPGGGALDITVGEYFTPSGHNLGGGGVKQGAGISPDVYVYDNPQNPGMHALSVAERVLDAKLP